MCARSIPSSPGGKYLRTLTWHIKRFSRLGNTHRKTRSWIGRCLSKFFFLLLLSLATYLSWLFRRRCHLLHRGAFTQKANQQSENEGRRKWGEDGKNVKQHKHNFLLNHLLTCRNQLPPKVWCLSDIHTTAHLKRTPANPTNAPNIHHPTTTNQDD